MGSKVNMDQVKMKELKARITLISLGVLLFLASLLIKNVGWV
jgi:hypothetical protein